MSNFVPRLNEVFEMAKDMHELIVEVLESVEPEDNSGKLTSEYLGLTTALLGCKTIIIQMEKMSAKH
jgi:hypothetical protein